MAEFTFYTFSTMSRGQIARWALHEAGADYDQHAFDENTRPADFTRINPMNKVPALVHHHSSGDQVISETAAICHYLAETHPGTGLLPQAHEKAPYFRWLFFAAGPIEQAVVARAMGWEVAEGQTALAGFGSLELTLDTLAGWLDTHDFAAGSRFTMADVYLGSQCIWGLRFGSIPSRAVFEVYVERLTAREPYRQALAIDEELFRAAQPG